LNNLEGILKTKKFDTPYNQTIDFLSQRYAAIPDIIAFDLVEYFQQYLKLNVGTAKNSEKKLKEELKSKLNN
jgi:hypothetical protein